MSLGTTSAPWNTSAKQFAMCPSAPCSANSLSNSGSCSFCRYFTHNIVEITLKIRYHFCSLGRLPNILNIKEIPMKWKPMTIKFPIITHSTIDLTRARYIQPPMSESTTVPNIVNMISTHSSSRCAYKRYGTQALFAGSMILPRKDT